MQPSEHELTVAVDAAARANWDIHRRISAQLGEVTPVFDSLTSFDQHVQRGRVLDVVRAVLDALPDRAEAERRRVGTYTLCGDGDGWCHHEACAVSLENGGHDTCTCGLDELLDQLREVAPL